MRIQPGIRILRSLFPRNIRPPPRRGSAPGPRFRVVPRFETAIADLHNGRANRPGFNSNRPGGKVNLLCHDSNLLCHDSNWNCDDSNSLFGRENRLLRNCGRRNGILSAGRKRGSGKRALDPGPWALASDRSAGHPPKPKAQSQKPAPNRQDAKARHGKNVMDRVVLTHHFFCHSRAGGNPSSLSSRRQIFLDDNEKNKK